MKTIELTYKELKFLRACVTEAGTKDVNFGDHMLEKLNYLLELGYDGGNYA